MGRARIAKGVRQDQSTCAGAPVSTILSYLGTKLAWEVEIIQEQLHNQSQHIARSSAPATTRAHRRVDIFR